MNYDGFFYINAQGDLTYDGPRPETPDEAWDISIAKWRYLSEHEAYPLYGDGGMTTCGLCMLFILKNCCGCPILADTKRQSCAGTPYINYEGDMETARAELEYLLALRARQ
jgi:hypothetical protein